MPRRKDISSILIIGAGPIIIGQACEFDYSGAQACKALKDEGYKVVLINSNPATIMTDPDVADKTYIEPITKEILEKILIKEKPDKFYGISKLTLYFPIQHKKALIEKLEKRTDVKQILITSSTLSSSKIIEKLTVAEKSSDFQRSREIAERKKSRSPEPRYDSIFWAIAMSVFAVGLWYFINSL